MRLSLLLNSTLNVHPKGRPGGHDDLRVSMNYWPCMVLSGGWVTIGQPVNGEVTIAKLKAHPTVNKGNLAIAKTHCLSSELH